MIVGELFKSHKYDRLTCAQLGAHTYDILKRVSRHAREYLDYDLHFILSIIPYPSLRMNEYLDRQQTYESYDDITIRELAPRVVPDPQEVFHRAMSFKCVLNKLSDIVGVTNKMLREYLLNGCAPFEAVGMFAGLILDQEDAEKYAYSDTFDVIHYIAEEYAKSVDSEEMFICNVNLFTLGCIQKFHKVTRQALSITPKLYDYEFFNSLAHCGMFVSITPVDVNGHRTIRMLTRLDKLICGIVMAESLNRGVVSLFSAPMNDFIISKCTEKGDWFKDAVYSYLCDIDKDNSVVFVDPSTLVDSVVYTSYSKFSEQHSIDKGRGTLHELMSNARNDLFDPKGCYESFSTAAYTAGEISADVKRKRVEAMAVKIPGHVTVLVDGTNNIASMPGIPTYIRKKRQEDVCAILLRSREVQAIKDTEDFHRLDVCMIQCINGEIVTNCHN